MRMIRSTLVAGAVVAASVLLVPAAAQAVSHTSASACLQGFSGPSAVVNSYGGITLKCGDPTKGVLHIDASHPIDEHGADDVYINQCMDNVIAYGSATGASTGNSAKRKLLSNGTYGYLVWRTSQKDVVTMYTSGSVSNNWRACAHG